MSAEGYGSFHYRAGDREAVIPSGPVEDMVRQFFTAPRNWSFFTRKTPQGDVVYMGDKPAFAVSFEALKGAVDRLPSRPPHPCEVLFPVSGARSVRRARADLLAAARRLAAAVEAEHERIGFLYGYRSTFLGYDPEPSWGGMTSGLRLPDDPHYYTLSSGLGVLDLSGYDPATRRRAEPADVRSREVIRTANAGDIYVCRRPVDLGPLREGLGRLVGLLERSVSETVEVSWEAGRD